MRALLALALTLVLAAGASAQTASPADGFVLIEVPTDALPDGYVESLPALPDDATVVGRTTLDAIAQAPSLAYELPAETLAHAAQAKDPTFGLLFSILIPGGGHIYAGETDTGLTLLAIGIGAPLLGALLSGDNIAPALIGYGVGIGAWVYGIIDGRKAVERYNAANGFALAPAPVSAGGDVGFGLAMRYGF